MADPRGAGDASLVWFQVGDLRLADQPALAAAAAAGPVVPFFAWIPSEEGAWSPGAASRWWLHHSLESLGRSLEQRGSRLIVRSGSSSAELIRELAAEAGARRLFFVRGHTPAERSRQQRVERLRLSAHGFDSRQLVEPELVRTQSDAPFRVFSAYWRAAAPRIPSAKPEAAPGHLVAPPEWPSSEPLESLGLRSVPDWAGGLRSTWRPGEPAAARAIDQFLDSAFRDYGRNRDFPDLDATSRLSPYLHFGEIGPRQIWHALESRSANAEPGSPEAQSIEKFKSELGWREFAAYLLFHVPDLSDHSLDPSFDRLEWLADRVDVRAWQRGRTGYPLIDAGMRQLWQTGWMHNRVRMAAASFFVKDLLQKWQDGARWFWDTLVDADLANNSLGWQWVAGSGPDAAPFTRVFNPAVQAQRFDPRGAYIRRFVPELASLPDRFISAPWSAPPLVLAEAGVALGRTYPWPIVDHAAARARALRVFNARDAIAGVSRPR